MITRHSKEQCPTLLQHCKITACGRRLELILNQINWVTFRTCVRGKNTVNAFPARNMNKEARSLSNQYFIMKHMCLVHLTIAIDYLHQQQMFLSELHNMYKGEL